jgi:serine/threonine-protein kinase
VILVERPRRRRGGYVAAAIALAALAVSGLALSPAGADIFDRLAGAGTTPTTAPDATTTTPTTGGTSSVATTDRTGASTSSSTETSVTAPSTETTESTDASSTHTTPTTGTTATSEVTTTEPPIVEVPHLTGETVSDALATLDHLGFSNVTVAEESSESIAAGGVTRTNPAAGKDVDPDDHLTVYRSTGSATVTVPSVVGHSRQAAINTLQEAGFTVKTQFKTLESGSDDIGKVLSQNPSGGTAPANSEITILVGRAPLVIDNPGNTLITGLPPTTSGP